MKQCIIILLLCFTFVYGGDRFYRRTNKVHDKIVSIAVGTETVKGADVIARTVKIYSLGLPGFTELAAGQEIDKERSIEVTAANLVGRKISIKTGVVTKSYDFTFKTKPQIIATISKEILAGKIITVKPAIIEPEIIDGKK